MDFTGRPMNSYIFVEPAGCRTEKEIKAWVERGAEFVATLESGRRTMRKKSRARVPAARWRH
jgi:hypothetical protein